MSYGYVLPTASSDAYHCPHCNVYANQFWGNPSIHFIQPGGSTTTRNVEELRVSYCRRCDKYAVWVGDRIVYPSVSAAPLPTTDMPDDVQTDYLEARDVVTRSPRSAAALLRLAVQKLTVDLGENGKNLNDDIGRLVKKGLPPRIQQALDAVRVIGNNAVHPGELDLRDDIETASALFGLVNMIVTVMITQPKEVEDLYSRIPSGALEQIERRDASP